MCEGGPGVPRVGKQTWVFSSEPRIVATGTVAGLVESEGPFGADFDVRCRDEACKTTWEKMEQDQFTQAVQVVLQKGSVTANDIDLVLGGDLNAQLTGFYFSHRDFAIPSLGLFSACATFTEALAVAGLAIDSGVAHRVLAGTSSHFSTAERHFRFPTEYGAQKPPTAQRTVTGAGVALVGETGGNVAITHATIGEIKDYGITSPWEMGAAMAPAAESTIVAHLSDTGRTLRDYDCVATGDLGRIGHAILKDLFEQRGLPMDTDLTDCGMMIFRPDQTEVFSGGSGAACSSLVTLAHFVKKLEQGEWRRVLVAATGALLSAVTAQQKETIPAICHAIVLERKDG
jgi:stage V sporulation protein AD